MVNVAMTVEQAVRLAINEEIKAHDLYMNLSKKVAIQETRIVLLELAEQELKHRLVLEEILLNDNYTEIGNSIDGQSIWRLDPKNAPGKLTKNADPHDTLLYAIREEINAINLYTQLASFLAGTDLEDIFIKLAREEEGHRSSLEKEYEKNFQL